MSQTSPPFYLYKPTNNLSLPPPDDNFGKFAIGGKAVEGIREEDLRPIAMQTQVLRQTASEIHAILNMWFVFGKGGGRKRSWLCGCDNNYYFIIIKL